MAVKGTLTESVYGRLRSRLLSGELLPGSKLKLSDFSAEYGVSLSVVREAVTRLAEQGLVQASPQRGFTVTPLSIDDLTDLTRARVLIETLALRESITHGDLAWESRVLATHHTLRRTPMSTSDRHVNPAFAEVHRAYHDALLAGCQSTRLESVAMGLRDCAELYLHWAQELAHDTDRDIAGEHQTIADLALDRDADAACKALAEHIERTTAALICYAEKYRLPGEDDTAIA
jgi:DNA-binding GntR family transcriptional regulator